MIGRGYEGGIDLASLLAFNICTCSPTAAAAASTSFVISSDTGLFGFARKPILAMLDTRSCNSVEPLRLEFASER